jgi:hypothetical protein
VPAHHLLAAHLDGPRDLDTEFIADLEAAITADTEPSRITQA